MKIHKKIRQFMITARRGVYAAPPLVVATVSAAHAEGFDLSTVSFDLDPIYAGALIVIGGAAAVWVVKKVISLLGGR